MAGAKQKSVGRKKKPQCRYSVIPCRSYKKRLPKDTSFFRVSFCDGNKKSFIFKLNTTITVSSAIFNSLLPDWPLGNNKRETWFQNFGLQQWLKEGTLKVGPATQKWLDQTPGYLPQKSVIGKLDQTKCVEFANKSFYPAEIGIFHGPKGHEKVKARRGKKTASQRPSLPPEINLELKFDHEGQETVQFRHGKFPKYRAILNIHFEEEPNGFSEWPSIKNKIQSQCASLATILNYRKVQHYWPPHDVKPHSSSHSKMSGQGHPQSRPRNPFTALRISSDESSSDSDESSSDSEEESPTVGSQ